MTVKELMIQLAKFDENQELHVSEHGKTMIPLFGTLETKDKKLLILIGSMEFKEKN